MLRQALLLLVVVCLGLARVPRAAGFVQFGAVQIGLRAATNDRTSAGASLRTPLSASRTRGRAWLRMSVGGDSSTGDESGSNNNIPFRQGDPEVLKAMAKAEAEAGNTTGAQALDTIATRMQTIMDRSTAKIANRLDVADTVKGGDAVERAWPFLNSRLISKGRDVWVSSIKEGPKSARGARSFEPGCFVTWKFRVNQLSGPMCVGLTSLAVDLDQVWSLDEHFNEALYITHNGRLYNGGQLIYETGNPIKSGDTVEFTLAGDMIYVTVNDELVLTAACVYAACVYAACVRYSSPCT